MTQKLLYDNQYDYVSWISNVSGRLFFRLTDGHNYRYDRIVGDVLHFNQEIDNRRIFFISLLADLRDLHRDNHSRFTRIIILASADPADCNGKNLYGNVYLMDDNQNNSLRKDSNEIDFLANIKTAIDNKQVDERVFEDEIESLLSSSQSKITKKIEFKIQDTGIIHLKKVDKHPVLDTPIDADVQAAFYLLKFTFHKDRHHSNSEENIIRIMRLDNIKKCKKENLICSENYVIAHHLIEGVKQYIAEKRKLDKSSKMFYNLKGVLNYANTMSDILIEYLPIEECKELIKHEQRCMENLDSSIERELEKKPYKPATFYEFLPELKNLLFIPLLILSAFYAFMRLEPSAKDDLPINLYHIEAYYLGSILFALAFMELIRKFYYRDDTFFIDSISHIPEIFLRIIKRYSNPNIAPKYRIFQYYIIPSIINIEMSIRRSSFQEKRKYFIFFFIFTVVSIVSMGIYLFSTN